MQLTINNLEIGYSRIVAKCEGEISIDFHDGYLCLLRGPNGSGKSTLLKTLSGLLQVKGGYFILPPFSCGIHYLPEMLELPPTASLRQILQATPSPSFGQFLISQCEIPAETPWQHLSWGNRRKAALAFSLARIRPSSAPKFLFWDEPFSGLDVESVRLVLSFLTRQVLTENTLMFLSAHGFSMLNDMAHGVIHFDRSAPSKFSFTAKQSLVSTV